MDFLTIRNNLFDINNKANSQFFYLLIFLFSLSLSGQELKSSFVLDTTKMNIFPYDLDFSLKVVATNKVPIKALYLYKFDKNEKVVFDRNTSLKKYKWSEEDISNDINKKIEKDTLLSQQRIELYKDSITIWKEKYKKILIEEKSVRRELILSEFSNKSVSNKSISDKLNSITRKKELLEYQINRFFDDKKLIKIIRNSIKKYVRQIKNKPKVVPLTVQRRIGDTIVVQVPALKPNKKYLIIALDYSDKVNVLREIVKEYKKYGAVKNKEALIIPTKYLPSKLENTREVIVGYMLKNKIDFIDSLITNIDNKPNFIKIDNTLIDPGSFKYPTTTIKQLSINDSIATLPKDASKEILNINALLVAFQYYGGSLVVGKYKIELDVENRVKLNFKIDTTKLKNRYASIINNLQLLTKSKQSLNLLADVHPKEYDDFDNYFDKLIKIMVNNKKIIEQKIKTNISVTKKLNEFPTPLGQNFTALEKNTHSYQFLTRSSGFIKPDFGILYYFSGNGGFSGAVPFTGFHIDIRRTNEDIPFKLIKGWDKRVTFQIGVPLFTDNLIDNNRRKHLVGNAFSLFLGVGYNISHIFRVSYGTLLFRGISGNSVEENTFGIKAVNAFSVGVNLKLKSLFEGIYGNINKLKE